jgi:hypothetical protein
LQKKQCCRSYVTKGLVYFSVMFREVHSCVVIIIIMTPHIKWDGTGNMRFEHPYFSIVPSPKCIQIPELRRICDSHIFFLTEFKTKHSGSNDSRKRTMQGAIQRLGINPTYPAC